MVVQVNEELCAGCGVCVDACSAGAIQMVDHHATILGALCTQCEACVEACPNGAITALATPLYIAPVQVKAVIESEPVPNRQPATPPGAAHPGQSLAPLASAALAYMGREIAPRLLDVLVCAIEHRLTRPTTTQIAPQYPTARGISVRTKGRCKRARLRRGRFYQTLYSERS